MSHPAIPASAKPRTSSRSRLLLLLTVWVVAVVSILPILFHWPARPPRISRISLAFELGYGAVALICFLIYRAESSRLLRRQALGVALFVFLLTCLTTNIHGYYVDYAPSSVEMPNEAWQKMLQNLVVQSDPGVLPHSYRFLPNGIVRWLEWENVPFDIARDLYRLLFTLLLFYAIYRYARLYTTYLGAILAVLLSSVVLPVSFEKYKGQLTDPLSHLSFALAFIFLETGEFAFFLTALLLGSLAKETVLCLSLYYVLFCRKDTRYAINAGLICAATLVAYMGVRIAVVGGLVNYQQISNVHLDHVLYNLRDVAWPAPFLLTAGIYLPFLALAWKTTPVQLRNLALFLLLVLFASSLLFSWLSESRNYMPVVFVLSVIAARYFVGVPPGQYSAEGSDST